MQNVDDLLLSFARDLNDNEPLHEFTIWSQEQLLEYYNEGLCLVASMRPDVFTKTVIAKIIPCTNEQEICECLVIQRVIGQVTEDGRLVKLLRFRKEEWADNWIGDMCPSKNTSFLDEYFIDQKTNTLFVYPLPSGNKPLFVKLECSYTPQKLTLDSDINEVIRCGFHAAAVQWVLYRAKMVDEVSPALRQAASQHLQTFQQILGLVQASDEKYKALLSGVKP